MGYKLRREVRDRLPRGVLSPAERLLVLEIADQCNDDTRVGYPGYPELAALTDLAERSIQELLNRVADKWVELRVVLSKDKKGNPVYSHRGRRVTFSFPEMPEPVDDSPEGATDPGPSDTDGTEKGATDPGVLVPEGATEAGGYGQKGATDPGAFSSEVPQMKSSSSVGAQTTVGFIAAATGASDDEAKILIEKIKTRYQPRKGVGAYVRGMSTEDLRDHLRELRAEANAARAERERKQRESDEARARAAENQRRAEQAAAQATGPSAEYLARKAAGWKKPPNPEAVPTPEELARIAAFLDAPAAEIDR